MKKVLAGILIFDMLLGILCLAVGTERYAEQKSYGTYIETDTGVCGTSGEPKKIALTFDDGPHPKYTEQLLDGLKERGVVATFFSPVISSRISLVCTSSSRKVSRLREVSWM